MPTTSKSAESPRKYRLWQVTRVSYLKLFNVGTVEVGGDIGWPEQRKGWNRLYFRLKEGRRISLERFPEFTIFLGQEKPLA